MRIFLIGSKGLLGAAVMRRFKQTPDLSLEAVDAPGFDISDYHAVQHKIGEADWVINAAEYSDIDAAETNTQQAYGINMLGARHVAEYCAGSGSRLLHISSDMIFDGQKPSPYTERDVPNPVNIYGSSKLAGEKAVRAAGGQYLLVRTQAMYGWDAPNFPLCLYHQIRAGATAVEVPDNRVMAPTYCGDIAVAIELLVRQTRTGVVHVASSGQCTWNQFARALAAQLGSDVAITAGVGGTGSTARRPAACILDNHWYKTWTGHAMPSWEEGLTGFLSDRTSLSNTTDPSRNSATRR